MHASSAGNKAPDQPIRASTLAVASATEIVIIWESMKRRIITTEVTAFYGFLFERYLPGKEGRVVSSSRSPVPQRHEPRHSDDDRATIERRLLGSLSISRSSATAEEMHDRSSRSHERLSPENPRTAIPIGERVVDEYTEIEEVDEAEEATYDAQQRLTVPNDAESFLTLMRIEMENQQKRHLELFKLKVEYLEEHQTNGRRDLLSRQDYDLAELANQYHQANALVLVKPEPYFQLESLSQSERGRSTPRTSRARDEGLATTLSFIGEPPTEPSNLPSPFARQIQTTFRSSMDTSEEHFDVISNPVVQPTQPTFPADPLPDKVDRPSPALDEEEERGEEEEDPRLGGTLSLPPLAMMEEEEEQRGAATGTSSGGMIDVNGPTLPMPSSPVHSPLRRRNFGFVEMTATVGAGLEPPRESDERPSNNYEPPIDHVTEDPIIIYRMQIGNRHDEIAAAEKVAVADDQTSEQPEPVVYEQISQAIMREEVTGLSPPRNEIVQEEVGSESPNNAVVDVEMVATVTETITPVIVDEGHVVSVAMNNTEHMSDAVVAEVTNDSKTNSTAESKPRANNGWNGLGTVLSTIAHEGAVTLPSPFIATESVSDKIEALKDTNIAVSPPRAKRLLPSAKAASSSLPRSDSNVSSVAAAENPPSSAGNARIFKTSSVSGTFSTPSSSVTSSNLQKLAELSAAEAGSPPKRRSLKLPSAARIRSEAREGADDGHQQQVVGVVYPPESINKTTIADRSRGSSIKEAHSNDSSSDNVQWVVEGLLDKDKAGARPYTSKALMPFVDLGADTWNAQV